MSNVIFDDKITLASRVNFFTQDSCISKYFYPCSVHVKVTVVSLNLRSMQKLTLTLDVFIRIYTEFMVLCDHIALGFDMRHNVRL